jgi:predicted metal-binding protein
MVAMGGVMVLVQQHAKALWPRGGVCVCECQGHMQDATAGDRDSGSMAGNRERRHKGRQTSKVNVYSVQCLAGMRGSCACALTVPAKRLDGRSQRLHSRQG